MNSDKKPLPQSLRIWFVIHFAVDIVFAIPLFFFPEVIMPMFGWRVVDPITTRLVGAALLSIGVESLLGRNASREVFKAMLNLKIIWAFGAVLGIGLGIRAGGPSLAWIFLMIFGIFLGVWVYYRYTLRDKSY